MVERFDVVELSDFLSGSGPAHTELHGQVQGLTEYRLDDGRIAYSGVIRDGTSRVQFSGGPNIATSGKDIPQQVVESTNRLAVLRYSAETGVGVCLGVFTSPMNVRGQDPAGLAYAFLHPAKKE